MATKRICSIEGCGKPAKARGWCHPHYRRWNRHGDPLLGRTAEGTPLSYLNEVVFLYDGEECLIWPFYRRADGYGIIRLNGSNQYVHRVTCQHRHGPPPTPDHNALHSCGRGKDGCCSQGHLRWGTQLENKADELEHGTRNFGERNGSARLTAVDVLKIRSLEKTMGHKEIAELFDISREQVSGIIRKSSWSWLD